MKQKLYAMKRFLQRTLFLSTILIGAAIQYTNAQSISYGEAFDFTNSSDISFDFITTGLLSNYTSPSPEGVVFDDTGTKLFVVFNATVSQYSVAVPFDLNSTTAFVDDIILSEETNMSDITFSADGNKLFAVGTDGSTDHIEQYSLGAAYDITSGVTHDGSFNVGSTNPITVTFNDIGTKMYVIEASGGPKVHQYSVATPYSILSGVTSDGTVSLSEVEFAGGLNFNHDGTLMFVLDINNDNIDIYEPSVAFDVLSTLTHSNAYNVSAYHTLPKGIDFSFDGKKFYVIGSNFDDVSQYSVTSKGGFSETASNTGAVEGSILVNLIGDTFTNAGNTLKHKEHFAISNLPAGFNVQANVSNNGHELLVSLTGSANSSESTDDITGAVFTFTDIAFSVNNASSISNSTAANSGYGITFIDNNPPTLQATFDDWSESEGFDYRIFDLENKFSDTDGHALQLTTNSSNTSVATVSITSEKLTVTEVSDGNTTITVTADDGQGGSISDDFILTIINGQPAISYGMGFDLSNNLNVSHDLTTTGLLSSTPSPKPEALAFNDDGTRLFVLFNAFIMQFSLQSPFDMSSTVVDEGYIVFSEETNMSDLTFSNDGTKLFVVGTNEDAVQQYALSAPFDIISGTQHEGFFYLSSINPTTVTFSTDGLKMFVNRASSGPTLNQYTLSSAFDVTSGVASDGSINLTDVGFTGGVNFNHDGTLMMVLDQSFGDIEVYSLTNPFNVTVGLTNLANYSVSGQHNMPKGIDFNYDGTKLYVVGSGVDDVSQYSVVKTSAGFEETVANDGQVEGSIMISSIFDGFINSGGSLQSGTDYAINNLPIGLVPNLSIASNKRVGVLTLSGNADNHLGASDISNLQFTFENSAFEENSASNVTNAVNGSSNYGIDFLENESNDIITFSFAEQTSSATIDPGTHTITINVEPGTNVSSLLPTVAVSSGANFSPSGSQNFTSNVNYTVTAENGTQQVWAISVGSQYEGTYSVKTGGDFDTPALANSSINSVGIAGDVILELDGSFISSFALADYDGRTEYSLTIRPAGSATAVQIGQMTLRGTENVTIDGQGKMTIVHSSTSGYAIWVDRQSSGSFLTSKNITIRNLTVHSSATGIYVYGGETVLIDNNRLELNTNLNPASTVRGIELAGNGIVNDVTVSNNVIVFDDQIDGASVVSGIGMQGAMISGTSSIYNNVVSLKPNDAGFVAGLNLSPQAIEAVDVYHNTISLDVLNGTGSGSAIMDGIRFAFSGANDASIRQICQNNIIELGNMNSGDKYGIRYSISDTPLVESGNNNVSNVGIGTFYYASINNVNYDDSNLTTLQGMITGFTNASMTFSDATNSDYSLAGVSLSEADLRGVAISSVPTDFDGNTRSTIAPSKGAFESPNNITDITSFTFTNQEGNAVIDIANHTVTAVISSGSDLTNIVPVITTFPGSSISPMTGVAQDFSSAVNYTLSAEALNMQQWTVNITEANQVPADITLDKNSIDENEISGTVVGTFTTTDADTGETYTYTKVTGTGDDDNASFTIDGNQIKSAHLFDFETKSSYSVRVNTNDGNGGNFAKAFVISIDNVFETPTDISLDISSINENNLVNDIIGELTSTDEDAGETYTYTLVSGTGDVDNASFNILNDQLRATDVFDFEIKDSYSVRINTNDGNGGNFPKPFTISINNLVETVTWNGSIWSSGTGPSSSDDAVIDGDYSIDTDGTFDVANMTINSGSTFTVDGENVFSVQVDLTNNGSMVVESGSSLLTFNANTISGNDITFKRNTRYADGKYSFVGSPVEQDASIIGSDLGAFIYSYDETVPYGSNEGLNRWIDASSDQLIPGTGYTQANQKEIVFSGMPNMGTVVHTGTYTEDTDDANEGWNLVSNPYSAAIDVADFLSANTNTSGAVYIWDDNGSDTQRGTNSDYIIANGTMATNTTPAGGQTRYNQALGLAQGFFVKLNNNFNKDITFNEGMRLGHSNSDDNFFRKAELPIVRINLSNDQGLFKQAVIGFADDATAHQMNRKYDAAAFDSNAENGLFTTKANQALALNGMPLNWDEIALQVNIAEEGIYQISVDLDKFNETSIYLRDNQEDITVDLSQGAYTFSTGFTTVPNRFQLLASPKEILGFEDVQELIFAYNNILYIQKPDQIEKEYKIFNMQGKSILTTHVEGSTTIELNTIPAGVYLVFDGIKSHKIILK